MQKTLAIILAGGKGNRLGVLTDKRAKPAVPFGGKYRIIDFTLSNCVNSLIRNVCVLTQYRPHSLMEHLGRGAPWDLNRNDGGLTVLHPHPGGMIEGWYRGTADAVFQNLPFIRNEQPELVLILSGDHIYQMDYARMIAEHHESGAKVTVAAREVPWKDAPRFGVIETEENGTITRFVEKAPDPPSNLANMGIYIFNRELLDELLVRDAVNIDSEHDFGRDILPTCVERRVGIRAHLFSGRYWRDVGTLASYWQANMDLVAPLPEFNLYDHNARFHTRSVEAPAVRFGAEAKVATSLISNGCRISGTVINSVISPNVEMRAGAIVRDSIIFSKTVIEEGARVDRAVIDKNVRVGKEAVIGSGDDFTINSRFPEHYNTGLTVIGKNSVIPPKTTLGRNVCVLTDVDAAAFEGKRAIPSGSTIEG